MGESGPRSQSARYITGKPQAWQTLAITLPSTP